MQSDTATGSNGAFHGKKQQYFIESCIDNWNIWVLVS
jgi:hypothetical protein